MPRFFFDVDDGERQFRDEIGIDLADPQDVTKEAFGLLCDLAHVHLPIARRDMAVEVRGAAGTPVYRAVITIVGKTIE